MHRSNHRGGTHEDDHCGRQLARAGRCRRDGPAGDIIGGSSLLDAGSQAQLERWLGAGEFNLNNVYTREAGDTIRSTSTRRRTARAPPSRCSK
jgi:hypothetical protein